MTAVEWLVQQINKQKCWADPQELEPIITQANKMFEQQIIDAHLIGLITSLETEATKQASEYYNETYGK